MSQCIIDNCNNNKILALGLCSKHYKQSYRKRNPEYSTWECMKARCYNPKNKKYHRYGGRGIIVCPQWKNDFKKFLSDMGKKPFKKAQIDRKDNNKSYYPENCHWTSNTVNSQNTCRTKLTFKKAQNIRSIYKEGIVTSRALGKMFDVNKSLILDIVHNRKWKDLTNGIEATSTTA